MIRVASLAQLTPKTYPEENLSKQYLKMANGMYYLTVGMGLLLTGLGVVKVAPIEPAHSNMVSLMARYSQVLPIRAIGVQMSADMYCALTGVIEIFFGALLAFGRFDWPVIGGTVALALSVNGLYCQVALREDPVDFIIPIIILIVILFMLFGRHGLWTGHGKVHLS